MMTCIGKEIPDKVLDNYLEALVGRFFKILPMKEAGEETLPEYLDSLRCELIGMMYLVEDLNYDDRLASLIFVIECLIEEDCDVDFVRREVFKSIKTCKKLREQYFGAEV